MAAAHLNFKLDDRSVLNSSRFEILQKEASGYFNLFCKSPLVIDRQGLLLGDSVIIVSYNFV